MLNAVDALMGALAFGRCMENGGLGNKLHYQWLFAKNLDFMMAFLDSFSLKLHVPFPVQQIYHIHDWRGFVHWPQSTLIPREHTQSG